MFRLPIKIRALNYKNSISRCISNFPSLLTHQEYAEKKILRAIRKTMLQIGDPNLLLPPENIRGLKELDKTVFQKQIEIPVLEFGNAVVSNVLCHLKPYVLKMENLKAIQSKDDQKYVLLNPLYLNQWTDLSDDVRGKLEIAGISEQCFKIMDFTLRYENWRADELLRSVLPEDKQSVAGFSIIGHIIHLNLREHVFDYKHIIGQILLEKVKGCRTVVNKLDKIDNTYRNFEMEILCGDKDMLVEVKENQCIFAFDFSTVYWNPRLSTEHERIVAILKPADILFDVFAGVGPFAIPAAKKRCFVFANDLNPESYRWLNHNAQLNKIKPDYLKTYNKDGRDFIQNELKSQLTILLQNPDCTNVHIVMNLPALAVEFLPFFNKLLADSSLDSSSITKFPTVHVYCFAKGEHPVDIARDLIETHLGHKLVDKTYQIFNVRTVSNFKEMMRVSFELNRDILFGNLCRKRNSDGNDSATTSETKKCNGFYSASLSRFFFVILFCLF